MRICFQAPGVQHTISGGHPEVAPLYIVVKKFFKKFNFFLHFLLTDRKI